MEGLVFAPAAILGSAIFVVHLVVSVGIIRSAWRERGLRKRAPASEGQRPSVSLVVPARDEESLLPQLLVDIRAQSVPEMELVLVNDRSGDRTPEIMNSFASESEKYGVRTVVVNVDEVEVPGNPKQNALALGARVATGEVLLFTDADCRLKPVWVERMLELFRIPEIVLCFGPVVPAGRRVLDRYQGFDQLFRYFYTVGSAGLDNPTGGFGNNLAIRSETLSAVGGFENLRYSVTEDAELISSVRRSGLGTVHATIDPECSVAPMPHPALGKLVGQSIRWNTGGLFAPDPSTRLAYGTVMLFLFLSVLILPLGALTPALMIPAFGSFASMTLISLLSAAFSRAGFRYWLLIIPNVLFSMLLYTWVTLLTLARRPIVWKGSRLDRM
jgi:cellulose synthase/poly-beta-1,6-N-acetylglucosamine synthase-like glycosyltransferase